MITIKVNGKEMTLKYNSSMRVTDFAKLNEFTDKEVAVKLHALCGEAHARTVFGTISFDNLTSLKETAVLKQGQFRKRVTVQADGGIIRNAADSHLIDTWIDKRNVSHSKAIERALLAKQALEAKKATPAPTPVTV